MQYNCSFDDQVVEAVKLAATDNMRSLRKQLHLYVIQGLQREGYLPTLETNKKADCIRQDNQSALTKTNKQEGI